MKNMAGLVPFYGGNFSNMFNGCDSLSSLPDDVLKGGLGTNQTTTSFDVESSQKTELIRYVERKLSPSYSEKKLDLCFGVRLDKSYNSDFLKQGKCFFFSKNQDENFFVDSFNMLICNYISRSLVDSDLFIFNPIGEIVERNHSRRFDNKPTLVTIGAFFHKKVVILGDRDTLNPTMDFAEVESSSLRYVKAIEDHINYNEML